MTRTTAPKRQLPHNPVNDAMQETLPTLSLREGL